MAALIKGLSAHRSRKPETGAIERVPACTKGQPHACSIVRTHLKLPKTYQKRVSQIPASCIYTLMCMHIPQGRISAILPSLAFIFHEAHRQNLCNCLTKTGAKSVDKCGWCLKRQHLWDTGPGSGISSCPTAWAWPTEPCVSLLQGQFPPCTLLAACSKARCLQQG